ncbi:hypothetical protein D3C74_259540 [compost metagenome]
MRIDLSLKRLQLGLFLLDSLHVHTVDQPLDISGHNIKRVGDMHEFVIPREANPLLKIAFLKRADEPNNPLHLPAGQPGHNIPDKRHTDEADPAYGKNYALQPAGIFGQVRFWNQRFNDKIRSRNRFVQA